MILEKVKKHLPSRKAFTALLVGGILAILIGAILLIISYVVLSQVMATHIPAGTKCVIGTTNVSPNLPVSGNPDPQYSSAGLSPMCTNGTLNSSFGTSVTNIAMALNIAGISMIVAGIACIIYMLIGLTRSGGSR